jgi:hypothetical protein
MFIFYWKRGTGHPQQVYFIFLEKQLNLSAQLIVWKPNGDRMIAGGVLPCLEIDFSKRMWYFKLEGF